MARGVRVWRADELGERAGFKRRLDDADAVTANFVEHQAQAWRDARAWAQDQMALAQCGPGHSPNGPGSSWAATEELRGQLGALLARHGVRTVLDAACGDWNWMSRVDLSGVDYLGWDVDKTLIEVCRVRAAGRADDLPTPGAARSTTFEVRNVLTEQHIPKVDLIVCRDFLAHLPNEYIAAVLGKFAASGSTFLLASNYPHDTNDFVYDPMAYTWIGYCEHPANLAAPPFNLAGPVEAIAEAVGPAGVLTRPHELALFRLAP